MNDDLLQQYFGSVNPPEDIKRRTQGIREQLEKIELQPLKTGQEKYANIGNITDDDETERLLQQYQHIRHNLIRIWAHTKDRDLLKPLLYIKQLEPFNNAVDQWQSTGVKDYELLTLLGLFRSHIEKLISIYHKLHTKSEEDETLAMLEALQADL